MKSNGRLRIDGVIVDGFDLGVYSSGANTPNPGANQSNDNLKLINSTITNNAGQGWLGSCNDCLIDHNKFINNGFARAIFNHNFYIDSHLTSSGIIISNNTLYQSALVEGKCSGVSLVVHGVIEDLIIQDNTVYEDLGAANETCWGISVDPGYASEESFSNVQILNNKVTNVGNVGIGCASCVDLKVSDNKIIHSQDFGFVGIKLPVRTEDTVKSDRVEITGNYIDLLDSNNKGKQGIVVPAIGDINVGINEIFIYK